MTNQRPAHRSAPAYWSVSQPRRSRENLAFALAASLYLHALIVSLRFGIATFGLPGLAFPWTERRVEASSELTVRLVEPPRAPVPAPAPSGVPAAVAPKRTPERAPRQPPPRGEAPMEAALVPPKVAQAPQPPTAKPLPETRAPAPAKKRRARQRKPRAAPQPPILVQDAPREDTFSVPPPQAAKPRPPPAAEPAPATAAESAIASTETTERAAKESEEAQRVKAEQASRRRAEEDARKLAEAEQALAAAAEEEAARIALEREQAEAARRALELEARARAEQRAKLEAEALAQSRALALQKEQEAKRREQEAEAESLRLKEAARIEEAARVAIELEALRRAEEAARQQALANKKKELEAQRLAEEAARAKENAQRQQAEAEAAAAAGRERERLAGQQPRIPGTLSGQDLARKALDQLRSARTDPPQSALPPARATNPRRRSVLGNERDVGLRMYVESWRWKIERNGKLNYRPSAGWSALERPIVTVSIRSDGSLEDVVIHRSSGLRELDEAVRRIARLQAPYSAFPPALARQYDVIEIRRAWSFDETLRILDDM